MNKAILLIYIFLFSAIFACQNSESRIGPVTIHHGFDLKTEPQQRKYANILYKTLWEHCLSLLSQLNLPIRSAAEGEIRTKKIDQEGVAWRLYVHLVPGENFITVQTYMEVRRHTEVEDNTLSMIIDSMIGKEDLEEQRDELEEEYQRGNIPYSHYVQEKDLLEKEIETKEALRREIKDKKNYARINRVTYPGRMFLLFLDDRVGKHNRVKGWVPKPD